MNTLSVFFALVSVAVFFFALTLHFRISKTGARYMKHPSEYTLGELATMVRVDGTDDSDVAHDCRDLRNCISALLIFAKHWQDNSAQYQRLQMQQEAIRKRNEDNRRIEAEREAKKARRHQPFSL